MNQENQTNNQFIYDLYDNIGTAKRTLNNILESIEEKTQTEEDVTDSIVFEITIEEIASNILWISHDTDTGGDRASRLIEYIKDELAYSFNRTLPYESTPPTRSIEYIEYNNSISEIIDLYLNDRDITKSEHYNNVLHFLVKKIYIRGM